MIAITDNCRSSSGGPVVLGDIGGSGPDPGRWRHMNRLRDLERHGLATLDTVAKLARVLGVDVDTLTGRKAAP